MRIGGAMFFTDYSMSPTELARALEERGFDSLWVPEHSHIPLSRKSPFPSGGDDDALLAQTRLLIEQMLPRAEARWPKRPKASDR